MENRQLQKSFSVNTNRTPDESVLQNEPERNKAQNENHKKQQERMARRIEEQGTVTKHTK
jgi:hypothetical protein